MKRNETPVKGRGRPRSFDHDRALAAALRVFWARGYDGASLNELTQEMGISRPSLYNSFGNKEELFRKTLDLYEREKRVYLQDALEAPTSRGVAERLLFGSLEMLRAGYPMGCLDVAAGIVSADAAIQTIVNASSAASDVALNERFQRASLEGDLPPNLNPAAFARLLIAVTQGLTVQASSGASDAELAGLVDTALSLWP